MRAAAQCPDCETWFLALIWPVRGGWLLRCPCCGTQPTRAPGPPRRSPATNGRLARYAPTP